MNAMLELEQKLHARFLSLSDPVQSLRKRAWERFQSIRLPDKRAEAYQYVPLREFYQAPLADLSSPWGPTSQEGLVFVEGKFRPDLSTWPGEIVVLPMSEALRGYGAFIQGRFAKQLTEEQDPFAALNMALQEEGVFIFVPSGVALKAPLRCFHWSSRAYSFPRMQLFLGARSELQLFSRVETQGESWMNRGIDIALEEEAQLSCSFEVIADASSWMFDSLRATLKRGSRLHSVVQTQGAKTVRQDWRVQLMGEGAEAELRGLSTPSESRQVHHRILMEHHAPHCRSLQQFKGVLSDKSRSSFEGKIFVAPIAQKTEAYQVNHTLLLGEHALSYSKPNLEIFADDVKASHGATVGQLDPDQLLYLRARGLSELEAKRLLIEGFCKEILDYVPRA